MGLEAGVHDGPAVTLEDMDRAIVDERVGRDQNRGETGVGLTESRSEEEASGWSSGSGLLSHPRSGHATRLLRQGFHPPDVSGGT